jgi:hypothetical protein
MVIMKLDVKNACGSLYARLVLDVFAGKASSDYECGIKIDEDFETAVYELRAYFGFFKLARACEYILRFFSYYIMGLRITSSSKLEDYRATPQNSWSFVQLPLGPNLVATTLWCWTSASPMTVSEVALTLVLIDTYITRMT